MNEQQTSFAASEHASHAIVVGGSMAGLFAARALIDSFDQVTVIERDRFPERAGQRAGVPQARHVHVLLMRGQRILEHLFPGLGAELAAAGAPTLDWIGDFAVLSSGGWMPRFPSGLVGYICSRNLLEWMVRRRLVASGKVRFWEACQVAGLVPDRSNLSVTGVRVRRWGRADSGSDPFEEAVPANFVVDASGRGSHAPQWLAALGYAPPQETMVNSFLGYASCWYQRPDSIQGDWKGLLIGSLAPHIARGGGLYPAEGDRWIASLGGVGKDYPPTDEHGFLEFARSLRSPILYEAIKDAQPLSAIYGYRRTDNQWRHYEHLEHWPERFVVLGDAVCTFNPIYGQGMTVAGLGALTLQTCLREHRRRHPDGDLSGLAHSFQQQLAKINATPWLMATGEDFRWPTTQGGTPDRRTRLMHKYMDHVIMLSVRSPSTFKVFVEVVHMVRPPTALFQPRILLRVLRHALASRSQATRRRIMGSMPPRMFDADRS
jgi:2-polyprenyl-6-methoxyphenol hydroxylase-like FAD-dependent oxidoreductase